MNIAKWMSGLLLLTLAVFAAPSAWSQEQLAVSRPIQIFPGEGAFQRTPDIAFGAGKYLVVWQDGWNGAGGDSNILGALLDAEGKLLSKKPIEICKAKGAQDSPSVTFLGGQFVVVWQDLRNDLDYDIYFSRVASDGKVVQTNQPLVKKPRNQALPHIASSGNMALVVWQELGDDENYRVYGSRLSADGGVLDAEGFQVSKDAANTPSVAASKEAFLVIWTRARGSGGIRGARVGRDGKVLAEIAAHGFHGGPRLASTASDGQDFIFVCSRAPFPNYWGWGGPSAFYGARILADGSAPDQKLVEMYKYKLFPNVLDGAWLHKGIWLHKYADVAWNGKDYVAIWTRAHIQNRVMLTNFDLYTTRIRFPGWQKLDSPTGPIPERAWEMEVQPVPGIAVADTPDTEAMPALCGGPEGKVLVAYELHKPDGAIEVTAKLLTAP